MKIKQLCSIYTLHTQVSFSSTQVHNNLYNKDMASSKFVLFVVLAISLSCIANSQKAQMENDDSYLDNKFRPRFPPHGGRFHGGGGSGGHGVGLGGGSGGLRGAGSGIRSSGGIIGGGGLGGGATFGGSARLGGSVGLVGGGGIGFGGGSVGFSGVGGLRGGVGLGGHDSFAHDSASEAKLGGGIRGGMLSNGDTNRRDFESGGEANNVESSGGSGGKV